MCQQYHAHSCRHVSYIMLSRPTLIGVTLTQAGIECCKRWTLTHTHYFIWIIFIIMCKYTQMTATKCFCLFASLQQPSFYLSFCTCLGKLMTSLLTLSHSLWVVLFFFSSLLERFGLSLLLRKESPSIVASFYAHERHFCFFFLHSLELWKLLNCIGNIRWHILPWVLCAQHTPAHLHTWSRCGCLSNASDAIYRLHLAFCFSFSHFFLLPSPSFSLAVSSLTHPGQGFTRWTCS